MLYSFSMNLNREFKIKKLFVEKIFARIFIRIEIA